MRIELTPSAWKAEVLPLNYIRIKLERKTRFELATLALARRCSTPEPLPQIGRGRWIRTIESSANGFTVRPLWPLGNPSKFCLPDYYTITFVNVQQIFSFLLELVEGITQMLRICRSCHRSAWLRTSRCFKVHRTFPLRSSPFGFDSLYWSWWRESNPQPADYKSAALPLSHTSESLKKLATWNGLEPSTSSVTGWHSNQLNYQAALFVSFTHCESTTAVQSAWI